MLVSCNMFNFFRKKVVKSTFSNITIFVHFGCYFSILNVVTKYVWTQTDVLIVVVNMSF